MRNLFAIMLLAISSFLILKPAIPAQDLSTGTAGGADVIQQAPGQEPGTRTEAAAYDIIIASKSGINQLSAGKHLRHYLNIDAGLSRKIHQELQQQGLNSGPLHSKDNLKTGEHQHLLTYRIESLEFGFKTPFGRHTRLKVSYAFQKKPGDMVISGAFEEHSKKGWKNCVRTISKNIADDVSNALTGKFDRAGQQKKRQATPLDKDDKTVEERLQKLDELKAKGLVTQEEYTNKREEILQYL